MARFGIQNRQLGEKISSLGGGTASPEQVAGRGFVESLSKIDESLRKGVSGAYETARKAAGREMEVPTQGLAQDFEKVIRDYGRENVPAAIKVRAAELGLMGGKQNKSFTVNDAEDWLQAINRNYDPMKKAQASALDQLRTAVKNAVLSADDQGGVYAAARTAAAKRFQLQDMVPALKAAAQDTINPDDFVQRFLVKGKTDDVKALAQLLGKEDPGALLEAKRQIGAQLLRAAFGENPAGDALFRPTQYSKLLRQIGDEKLRSLFSYEELAQMKALVE